MGCTCFLLPGSPAWILIWLPSAWTQRVSHTARGDLRIFLLTSPPPRPRSRVWAACFGGGSLKHTRSHARTHARRVGVSLGCLQRHDWIASRFPIRFHADQQAARRASAPRRVFIIKNGRFFASREGVIPVMCVWITDFWAPRQLTHLGKAVFPLRPG